MDMPQVVCSEPPAFRAAPGHVLAALRSPGSDGGADSLWALSVQVSILKPRLSSWENDRCKEYGRCPCPVPVRSGLTRDSVQAVPALYGSNYLRI